VLQEAGSNYSVGVKKRSIFARLPCAIWRSSSNRARSQETYEVFSTRIVDRKTDENLGRVCRASKGPLLPCITRDDFLRSHLASAYRRVGRREHSRGKVTLIQRDHIHGGPLCRPACKHVLIVRLNRAVRFGLAKKRQKCTSATHQLVNLTGLDGRAAGRFSNKA
jgi:hypothetical protein